MTSAQMLDATKLALRISTNSFDTEIKDLLDSALLDLGVAGVEVPTALDKLVQQACITYVKVHFGEPDEFDRLKKSYDEQKAQLVTCTGYTDWLDGSGA